MAVLFQRPGRVRHLWECIQSRDRSSDAGRVGGPRIMWIVALMAVLVELAPMPVWADDVGPSKSELIHSLLPTVVAISVRKEEPANPAVTASVDAAASGAASLSPPVEKTVKSYVGSGFVIDPSGVIVTNYHVIEDAFEVTVGFSDSTRLSGRVMSASRLADLALVKVEAEHPLPAAHWGDSDQLQVGDQVFAAGNPFGLGLSVSGGIISGLNRDIQDSPYDDFIQTDATINHGNSGGPLFDMQGNVIGVNSTIISPTAGSVGLGFAIPASNARFVTEQLRTYGWLRPGWIGVKLQTVTPEIAGALGMRRAQGCIVSWVLPGAPAMKAGLAIGDVIERFDGVIPTDDRALLRGISHTEAGGRITLTVRHDDKEREVVIVADAWPRNQWDARDAPIVVQRPKTIIAPDLGLSLVAPAVEERSRLGLENGLTGVLVTNVVANSDTSRRGMVGGDLILRVQDKPVATPEDVKSGIDAARADKREFVLMLILPKVRNVPGPKWLALQTGAAGG